MTFIHNSRFVSDYTTFKILRNPNNLLRYYSLYQDLSNSQVYNEDDISMLLSRHGFDIYTDFSSGTKATMGDLVNMFGGLIFKKHGCLTPTTNNNNNDLPDYNDTISNLFFDNVDGDVYPVLETLLKASAEQKDEPMFNHLLRHYPGHAENLKTHFKGNTIPKGLSDFYSRAVLQTLKDEPLQNLEDLLGFIEEEDINAYVHDEPMFDFNGFLYRDFKDYDSLKTAIFARDFEDTKPKNRRQDMMDKMVKGFLTSTNNEDNYGGDNIEKLISEGEIEAPNIPTNICKDDITPFSNKPIPNTPVTLKDYIITLRGIRDGQARNNILIFLNMLNEQEISNRDLEDLGAKCDIYLKGSHHVTKAFRNLIQRTAIRNLKPKKTEAKYRYTMVPPIPQHKAIPLRRNYANLIIMGLKAQLKKVNYHTQTENILVYLMEAARTQGDIDTFYLILTHYDYMELKLNDTLKDYDKGYGTADLESTLTNLMLDMRQY